MGDVRRSIVFRLVATQNISDALRLYAEDQRDESLAVNWDSVNLGGAFIWGKSERGHTFWSNMSFRISMELDDPSHWEMGGISAFE